MSMPKKGEIKYYWESFLIENERYIHKDNNYCWACGSVHKIQRCHLIAKSENGSDEVNNIILLCGDCHVKTEMFSPVHTFNYILSTEFIHFYDHMENIACRRFGYEIKNIENYRAEFSMAVKNVIPTFVQKYKKSEQEIKQDKNLKIELINKVYEQIKVGPSNEKSEKYIKTLHLNSKND